MTHFFFDLRSAHNFSRDRDGMELPDDEAAHDIALGALTDAAREAVTEGATGQQFAVEVRNGVGPILEVSAVFSSRIFRRQ
ncbi:hypothetical protein JQ625_23780 [Bradyrhizobium diazoefficiens]|nr:hypothetical protein [Bradyrhizobium diazoefficiens]MBR0777866.1 hypothetical protein [Bradyrhizobium diazoefficiens]